MAYTFRGGIHVEEYKNTRNSRVETLPAPAKVSISLSQHIGAPAAAIVKKGDAVTVGQKIGEVNGGLGCPVHSSISGTVTEIVKKTAQTGMQVEYVVIQNDFKDTPCPDIRPVSKKLTEITSGRVNIEKKEEKFEY